jgi:hypothetical protein
MNNHASFARRGVARLLIGPLAALWLAVPVLAGPGERPDEKSEAAKVAKKMQKALATSHKAEEEREALRHFQDEVAEYADIVQPEVQPLFRRLIAEQLKGPDALDAPRSTVPPSLLATLPPLPACLHYRFVERDLILVDAVAQLIVDILPAAAPDLAIR